MINVKQKGPFARDILLHIEPQNIFIIQRYLLRHSFFLKK